MYDIHVQWYTLCTCTTVHVVYVYTGTRLCTCTLRLYSLCVRVLFTGTHCARVLYTGTRYELDYTNLVFPALLLSWWATSASRPFCSYIRCSSLKIHDSVLRTVLWIRLLIFRLQIRGSLWEITDLDTRRKKIQLFFLFFCIKNTHIFMSLLFIYILY